MEVEVQIPAALRHYTGGSVSVVADGETLADVIDHLGMMFEGFKSEIIDDLGEVRADMRVTINGEDIRFLERLGTALHEGDVVAVVPANLY